MNNYQFKSTKSMKAVGAGMVIDSCCEPDCGMTILVEKDDKDNHRQNRCTSCIMRAKMHGANLK